MSSSELSPRLGMRTHYCGALTAADAGQTVTLCGWVARRREHGEHLAFLDVRDHTGFVQCVVDGAHDLRSEYVVKVTGVVRPRPEGTVNTDLATGEVEVGECTVEVLSQADPPPFPLDDRTTVDETLRLRHRYLDLRREKMQRNLRTRASVYSAVRGAMEAQGFVEVETPMLISPTPEGARDFVVPSRLHPGSMYALPQSPQLFKQLLMVGGFDRYYQIARCMRDEDLRADRQFEFVQLDMEMAFASQDDVHACVSGAVMAAAEAVRGERPEVGSMTWREAMSRFGSDKPDLRFGLELHDVAACFRGTGFQAFASAPSIIGLCQPGGADMTRKELDALVERAQKLGAKGLVWMKVEAEAITAPVAKFLTTDELGSLRSALQAQPGDLLLLVADEWRTACEVLGQLRLDLGRPPVGEGPLRFTWVTEFPLFEEAGDGSPTPSHHPFTMPHPDDLDRLETDPLSVRSQAYDLVLNGWELGSGSVRIHRRELQQRIFDNLGISAEEAAGKFGFLLEAFRFGAPPHAGFAFGLDRLAALLVGEENIREVIAYPKTQSGADPLTDAPRAADPAHLAEVGLRLLPPKE